MKAINVVKNAVTVISFLIIIAAVLLLLMSIKPAVVLSGSMEPEIKTGSLVFIDTRDREVKTGDIIAFSTGDIIVTHRAVRKTKNGWVTKGDNNDCEDLREVSEADLRGKVCFWIPKAGYLIGGIRGLIT